MNDDALFDALYRVNKKGEVVRRKRWKKRLDKLTGLPQVDDAFDFSFSLASTGNVTTEISITDSITDYTYVGGDSLTLGFFGTWKEQKANGNWRTKRKSFDIVLDSEGPFNATETYTVGSNQLNTIFKNTDNIYLTLTGSDNTPVFAGSVFVTDLFA